LEIANPNGPLILAKEHHVRRSNQVIGPIDINKQQIVRILVG
jgi:hypothetical protein